jgi:hypothetical protein
MSIRRFTQAVAFAASLLLAGCSSLPIASQRDTIEGSGTLATETRAVSGFSEIVLEGQGDAEIVFGAGEALVIEAEDNLLPYLTTTVRGAQLVISTRPNVDLLPTRPIRYSVTVTQLDGIRISGSGNVTVPEVVADRLEFEISGSGGITAAGAVDEVEAVLSGSGSIAAGDLQALAADVDLPGSGNIVVWATQRLHLKLGGSGSISYYGQPSDLEQEVTGSGTVRALGDK